MAKPSKERAKKLAAARTRKASITSAKPRTQEPDADPRSSRGTARSEPGSAKRAARPASPKRAAEGKAEAHDVGSQPVTIDRRRDDRRGQDADHGGGQSSQDKSVVKERRKLERRAKVNRRRQIDPTTCERDYSQEEIEFMAALDAYKRTSGRMFPTCSEVLEVLRGLGYEKRPPVLPTPEGMPATTGSATPSAESNDIVPAFPFAADAACEMPIPVLAGV